MSWSAVNEKKGDTKKTGQSKVTELRPSADEGKSKNELAKERGRDLRSGMELLELDFLLSIVENTKDEDDKDVTMRKLNFNELLRREQQNEIDSNALKVYAMDERELYGKNIQCEAMKELTKRTAHKS